MQKSVILTEEEYIELEQELRSYKNQLLAYNGAIKKVVNHIYKDDILVVELNKDKLKLLLGNENYKDIMIINSEQN